jgi:tetratricopeptide (TPR) repeat protein
MIIFSNSIVFSFSQTIDETIKFADSLVIVKNYDFALKEYQRVLFFQDTINSEIYFKIAETYFYNQNFTEAIKNYKIFNSCSSDSLKILESNFKVINCYIQNAEFHTALVNLYSLSPKINEEQNQRKNFYLGICYYYFDNYETSLEYFIESIDTISVENKIFIEDFFSHKNNFRYPNPKLAFAISLILPGFGQFYCGEVISGFNSMLLTASMLLIGYEISVIYKPIDAAIAVFPYFERYYLGGCLNAYNLAINKKTEKKSENFIKILEKLEE